MTRDITKIYKAEYLLPVLEEAIKNRKEKFQVHLERYPDLEACMRWGDTLFENAAEFKLFERLHYTITRLSTHEDPEYYKTEFAMEYLNEIINDDIRYLRPVGHSTSACSNLMEQHVLEKGLSFISESFSGMRWELRDAQEKDPEYTEEMDRRREENRKKQDIEIALAEAKKKEERRQKRLARKAGKEKDIELKQEALHQLRVMK